ncbi:beta-propeller domain-containing protein [Rossellomorea aquimaris]|uniref:beta-propeller domain-containing protein n=1 Tax=Rossellomorea aquimaris TaxID=189382 RepID=UPI0007D07A32|nr:beta-propeller domain-containing protein [Rossellomorea aquimaris]
MSKKSYLLSIAGIVLFFALAFVLYQQRPVVKAEGMLEENILVMENKTWNLQFSNSIQEDTVNSDNIYVKDSNGKKVDVTLKVSDDQRSIQIQAPPNGYSTEPQYYTLHISPNVKTKWGFSYKGDTEITYTVTSQLPSIQSKEELTQYFKKIMKKQKENQKHPLFGFSKGMEEESSNDTASGESEKSSSNHSETNNQVQGVDEGDMVKTDGNYIYQVANQQLLITKANPAKEMKVVSTVSFKGNVQPQHLFIQGDRILVIGNSWSPPQYKENMASSSMLVEGTTVALLYNISDKEKPALLRKVELEGQYVTARKIDSTVYFISNFYPNYWMAEDQKDVDLRPRVSDSLKNEKYTPIPVENIKYFPQSLQPNYTLISNLNMENPQASLNVQSYLGSGHQIYMSKENLYVAVEKYEEDDRTDWNTANTEIYKFAVNDSSITFRASGEVEGRALNQFSMDEHEGYFRIVTTKGEVWNDDTPSSNALYILDKNMKHVGEVTDLAKGERIYSARFMGDKAYMVTFKQVDPLFVIDTSDPAKPQVLGELKIPGFSTYLHPIDENHLIGFGFDTKIMDDNKEFNQEPRIIRNGMKISLFDITDFQNPQESHTEIIGGSGTHSYLLDDHKALFHEPSRNLYGFPISVYQNKEGSQFEQIFDYQGALVYEITPEKGIVLKAKLKDLPEDSFEPYELWEHQIQRLLYIENHLYTLSNSRINAYSLDNFTKESSIIIN